MRRALAWAAILGAATTCTGDGEAQDDDSEAVEGAALFPGEWTIEGALTEMEVEGIPAEETAARLPRASEMLAVGSRCFSAADAQAPRPSMFLPEEMMRECEITRAIIEDGKFEVALRCEERTALSFTGRYDADSLEADLSGHSIGDARGMSLAGNLRASRVGDCAG